MRRSLVAGGFNGLTLRDAQDILDQDAGQDLFLVRLFYSVWLLMTPLYHITQLDPFLPRKAPLSI